MELEQSDFSMRVIAVTKEAIYLRLSEKFQRRLNGGCTCRHCQVNPDLAKWDTLVIPTDGTASSYTAHLPDKGLPAFQEYVKANGLAV